jgi:hypothetical protein
MCLNGSLTVLALQAAYAHRTSEVFSMIARLKSLWCDKRGNALAIAGASLPLIIGSAGLATDTIEWALWKRQLQRTADSAAIAGVYARMAGQTVATQVANDVTKNNQTGMTLLSGPTITYPTDAANTLNSVAVQMQVQRTLSFSSFFMSSPPTITANATAAAVDSGEYCAQAQINTSVTGISAGGNVNVDLKCGMITNSTSMDAAVAFGSSSVKASPVAAVGGLDKTDNWAQGTVLLPFTLPQPDPYADIPAPTIPGSCSSFSDNPQSNQTWPATVPTSPVCITNMTIKGTLTLQPATYIITGDIKANSGANITCSGCTFIMTNATPTNTGTVDFNGGATLNLTAPDTGIYRGMLFYSNRGADPTKTNKINGNSSSTFKGAFYFPHQIVEFTGNAGVTFECIKLVSWQLTFLGNSTVKNNCPAGWYGDRFMGRRVRLVA